MTRISRRRIERGLHLPAPAPTADLGRRIKDQIPDDLFGAPDDPSRHDLASGRPLTAGAGRQRALARPAAWAVAASLMVAIGAGWLAVRLFETNGSERRVELLEKAEPLEKESAPATAPPVPQPAAQASKSRVEAPASPQRRSTGELGDAAADRPGSRRSLAVSLDRTSDSAGGRVVLLVIATAPMVEATPGSAPATDAIELELDPALVTGHRLLASHRSDPDLDAAPGSVPRAVAARQVTALYELEVAAGLERNTVLGTARLRDDGAAEDLEASTRLRIVAGDGATAAVSLRLAARADEAALPAEDVSPASVASLRAEIERLRAASEIDETTARRALELLDVLSR
jgi:hypothetical protein